MSTATEIQCRRVYYIARLEPYSARFNIWFRMLLNRSAGYPWKPPVSPDMAQMVDDMTLAGAITTPIEIRLK